MRPALTFSTRATSSHCLWRHCSGNHYIEQFFTHYKQTPPLFKNAQSSSSVFSRSASTCALKQKETLVARSDVKKIHPRMMNKDLNCDVLFDYLCTQKLTPKEIFVSLRTALYNTTQYHPKRAWNIYEKMVEYKVDSYLQPNHYGHLLCMLKYDSSAYRLQKVIDNMKKYTTPTNYHYSQVLFAMSRNGLGKDACRFMKSIPHPTTNHYHSLAVAVSSSKKIDAELLEKMSALMVESMKERNTVLDKVTRSMTVSLLAKHKQFELVVDFIKAIDQTWQKALTKGNPYTVYIYTSLIDGCGRRGDAEGAKKLYDEMRRHKIQPNQVTYTALMDAYGQAGDFTSSIRLITYHQRRYKKLCNTMLTSLVVNALRHDNLQVAESALDFMSKKKIKLKETDHLLRGAILWLKTKQDIDLGRRFFNELYLKDKRFVNNVMVNHLIKGYGRQEDKENVIKSYQKQSKLPKVLTAEEEMRTKHHLMDALFHCRDVPAAMRVFVSMRNQAIPDEITMAMIIKGLVLNKESDLAWRLFRTLQANGTEPNLHAYTSILKSLSDRGSFMQKRVSPNASRLDPDLLKAIGVHSGHLDIQHSPVPITTEVLNLFRRMTGFHQPNVYIYTTLISCFAKNNIYQAVNIFDHMCLNHINPTVETYTTLLQGCAIFRESDIAFKVLSHMFERQLEPNAVTWRYLLKSLVRARVDKNQIDKIGEIARRSLKNKNARF